MEFHGIMVFIALWFVLIGAAEKDKALVCSVCRAVVDEVIWDISKVDPKKTIQVGSFRVDSRGNQARYEMPYARSETHLTEVFESVCTRMNNYAETKDSAGRKSAIRTSARDGKRLKLDSISINSENQRLFKSTCESLVEDYEEDMIKILNRKDLPQNIAEKKICAELAGLCTKKFLDVPLPEPSVDDSEEADEVEDDEEEDDKHEPKKDDKLTDMDFNLDKMMADAQKKVADPTKEGGNSDQPDTDGTDGIDKKEEL